MASYPCIICGRAFAKKINMQSHYKKVCAPKQQGGAYRRGALRTFTREDGILESESAYNHTLTTFEIQNHSDIADLPSYFDHLKDKLHDLLTDQLNRKLCIKANFQLDCLFLKMDGSLNDFHLSTNNEPIYIESHIPDFLSEALEKLLVQKEESAMKNSGWTLFSIGKLKMKVSQFKALKGSSYLALPDKIQKSESCVNPQNEEDEECAKWAILAAFVQKDANRISKLKHFETFFDWSGMSFPTPVKDFTIFEKKNPHVSINVFGLTDKLKVFPIKVVDEEKDVHRDLLLIQHEEKSHYVLIKNFSRLLRSQVTLHEHRRFFCKRCFSMKTTQEQLDLHQKDCKRHKVAEIIMPQCDKEGNPPTLSFTHYQYEQRVVFTVYADFESKIVKIESVSDDPDKPSTLKIAEHKAMSFGLLVKSTLPPEYCGNVPIGYQSYRGDDAAKVFVQTLIKIGQEVAAVYQKEEKIIMSPQDTENHKASQQCYLCNRPYTAGNHKVADHCHITGEFRGSACNECNLLHRNPHFLPIFLHNLSGYDSHFIVKELGSFEGDVSVIPQSSEKFISFDKQVVLKDSTLADTSVSVKGKTKKGFKWYMRLRFLDSFRFMSSSLDSLARNLPAQDFKLIRQSFPSHLTELVVRKGVFCYEFVDDLEKMKQTSLPPQSEFYSKLTESDISDEDYAHAQLVWDTFNIQNLGEYSDLYLKIDVLLLADVFESFRDMCLNTYNLDCCWYYTVPGLAWDAALRVSKVTLDLMTQDDMLLMVEKGIRGGLSQCSKRFAEANNKYTVGDGLPPSNPLFLMYFDANNLYGWSMSQLLPVGGYEWVPVNSLPSLENLDENGHYGYILEVDVSYPPELHDAHNDLPYLPETLAPPGSKQKKLLATLYDKKVYVVHLANLKQALRAGLKLEKIHRVIRFVQAPWLKTYIELNTRLRAQGTSAFAKDFYKLMNNAVYGKTMENKRKHMKIDVVLNSDHLDKLVRKPDYMHYTIITESFVIVQRKLTKIKMDKPLAVGFCILELSKTLMYDFHYNTMVPQYSVPGKKLQLLYVDTDSLTYEIHTEDVYEDMQLMSVHFDTSDYPQTHPLYSLANKKVIGKFKDENNGDIMEGFIGLRSKMYLNKVKLLSGVSKVTKKSKGLKKYAINKKLTYEDYLACLQEGIVKMVSASNIRSYKHRVYTEVQNKVALSARDDKRMICVDGVHTRAHGHFIDTMKHSLTPSF